VKNPKKTIPIPINNVFPERAKGIREISDPMETKLQIRMLFLYFLDTST